MAAMATAAAKVLLSFFTSFTADAILAAAAMITLGFSLLSETCMQGALTLVIAWTVHFAAMSAIDIFRKGGNL